LLPVVTHLSVEKVNALSGARFLASIPTLQVLQLVFPNEVPPLDPCRARFFGSYGFSFFQLAEALIPFMRFAQLHSLEIRV
jgi:hypothetical protein